MFRGVQLTVDALNLVSVQNHPKLVTYIFGGVYQQFSACL